MFILAKKRIYKYDLFPFLDFKILQNGFITHFKAYICMCITTATKLIISRLDKKLANYQNYFVNAYCLDL